MAKKSKEKPPKPEKPAKPARAEKPARERAPTVVRPKPVREPVYTVLAAITLVASLVGCTLLYLDFEEYGKQSPGKEAVPTLPALGSDKSAAQAPG